MSHKNGILVTDVINLRSKALLNATLAYIAPQALQKEVIITDITDNDIWVRADADQFEFIFRNVLQNSVKFCDLGSKVTIGNLRAENPDMVTFFISDTGWGMDKKTVHRILNDELFAQVRYSSSGGGLGLSLCRMLLKNNGGDMKIETADGKGTVIYLSFPIANMNSELED
ncbi:MAG: HAMP domain-containing histidine kinase [Pedobacter sp.]|nr:MAG: HAMP domain-containing histidine kinase [Pedobacter sp.]